MYSAKFFSCFGFSIQPHSQMRVLFFCVKTTVITFFWFYFVIFYLILPVVLFWILFSIKIKKTQRFSEGFIFIHPSWVSQLISCVHAVPVTGHPHATCWPFVSAAAFLNVNKAVSLLRMVGSLVYNNVSAREGIFEMLGSKFKLISDVKERV